MSVLLPPRRPSGVFWPGRNIDYTFRYRLTDLINLNAADPAYKDGPLLPRGTLSNGALKPRDGKMYVSMVLLLNGNVFENGGGLINREDPSTRRR